MSITVLTQAGSVKGGEVYMSMNASSFLVKWMRAAADLGIDVVGPIELTLPSGAHVKAPVLVRRFGAPKGMLVLSDYALVNDLTGEIVQAGYGYSIMSEPDAGERYSRAEFVEVLSDWGWSGAVAERPVWLLG